MCWRATPFKGAKGSPTLDIPGTVKRIYKSAFRDCTGLTSVKLGVGIEEIHQNAFRDCTSLAAIEIPHTIDTVAEGTFAGCTALTSVTLPKTIVSIEKDAFSGCTALRDIYYAGSEAEFTAIEKAEGALPEGVTLHTELISERVIDGLVCLEDAVTGYVGEGGVVTLPAFIYRIGARAFAGCTGITALRLHMDVKEIAEDAFSGCDNLCDVYYPGYLKEWQEKGLTIPDGVTLHYKEITYRLTAAGTKGKESVSVTASVFEPQARELEACLMKVESDATSSCDDSDDERVTPSHSSSSRAFYREIRPFENTESLLFADGKIVGVIFRVKVGSKTEPHCFHFDGSVAESMRLGYSASHSSCFTYVERITLVRRGENGAPTEGGYPRYSPSENDPDF